MAIFVMADIIIATIALGIGILVLAGNFKSASNQSFFLFAVGISLSAIAKLLFWETEIFFWLLFASWGFEMIILGMLCLGFVPPDGKLGKRFLWSLGPWLAFFLSMPALLAVASFSGDPSGYFWAIYRFLFPFFTAVMGAYLISFFFSMRHEMNMFGLPPLLARGMAWIVAVSAAAMFIADFILPLLGIYHFAPASNLFAVAILAMGGYGAARYGTWNASVLLRKGVPYFLSLIGVAIIFFSIEFGIEKFFYQNDEVVDIFAAAVGALAFCPLRRFFDKVTDRFFSRNPYRFLAAAREMGERLSMPVDRNALLATIAAFLHMTVRPTETIFFAIDDELKIVPALKLSEHAAADYLSLAALFMHDVSSATVITDTWRLFRLKPHLREHDTCKTVKERAAQLGVAAIVPVMVRGKMKMIMMVGCKCSGALLNEDDGEFLGFAARRAAIALEIFELRALMDQQEKKFEARVTERTERLKNMYESQSRFLADVSHEFKTPLAILKMHAVVFAVSKDAEQKKSWYVMDATLDRLTRLVSHFSDAAKLDSPQDGLRKAYISVKELLREIYDDCAILTEDKGVNLRLTSERIAVFGEEDRLKEVLLNLVSNALQHTSAGGSILSRGMRRRR